MRALATRTPDLSPLHREFDDLLGRFFGNQNDWLPGVTTLAIPTSRPAGHGRGFVAQPGRGSRAGWRPGVPGGGN